MRTEMHKASDEQFKEQVAMEMSDRNRKADQLIEQKWSKTPQIGEGISDLAGKDTRRARNLVFALENQERHLQALTETQISTSFQTTPENVIRVVRLGYPNSVRGELFLEWAMETARDSIYYLSPKYTTSKRGATAGETMHESDAYRYASEIEEESIGTGDGTITDFNGTLSVAPVRPFAVRVFNGGVPAGVDDGAGNMVGAGVSGSVNYDTGAISVSFTTAPANGNNILVQSYFVSEDPALYDEMGAVELQLKDYQFRVKQYPLMASWSKMTELLLGTTLDIDAEEALVRSAGDELKKSLDYLAVKTAYQASLGNATVQFDTNGAVGESEIDRAGSFSRAVNDASDVMFNAINRGGVTKMVGGPQSTSYVQLHGRFDGSTRQPMVGVHRIGSLDDVDMYKAPGSIIPNDEILSIYRNELVPEDVSLACGSLVPLYVSPRLDFSQMKSEVGMSHFGDLRVLNANYLVRIKLLNL